MGGGGGGRGGVGREMSALWHDGYLMTYRHTKLKYTDEGNERKIKKKVKEENRSWDIQMDWEGEGHYTWLSGGEYLTVVADKEREK